MRIVLVKLEPLPLPQLLEESTHIMMLPKLLLLHLTLLFLSSTASSRPITTLSFIKQISADVFTCDSSNELLNAICKVSLPKINTELEAAGVSIDRDGILFTWEDPNDIKIDTRHSCTVTAKVKNQKATARITSGTRLKFSGDSLTEPFAFRLKLPIVLTGRIDVQQRFGVRLLGSCSNTGKDNYALKATFTTTANAMAGLALNPSLGVLDSGDYGLVIEPKVAVVSQILKPTFKFRVSGVSPITPVLTFVNGFGSSFFKSVTKIFTGESISGVFSDLVDALAFDVGVPIVLGIGALPRPLEAAIWDRIFHIDQRLVDKRTNGFGSDLEDKLQGDLQKIFKLGADGKRVFIIKKDIVELIRQSGIGTNVFIEPPVNPALSCEARAKQVCSSPDLNVIYDECIPLRQECQRLQRDYTAKYTPANVIVSKPRVASLPPPRTNPPPTTKPPTTRPPVTTDCNPRPGQHVEC